MEERVLFVSNDHTAFGKDELHPEQAGEAPENLSYYNANDGLLDDLAERREIGDEVINRVTGQEALHDAIRLELSGPELFFEIVAQVPPLSQTPVVSTGAVTLQFEQRGRPKAYEVNGQVWASCRFTWRAENGFTRQDLGGT
jgi:hypothetical protein